MEMKIDIFNTVNELMDDLKVDVGYLNGRTSSLESMIHEKADCTSVDTVQSRIGDLQEQMAPVNAFQRIADDYKELESYRYLGSIYFIQERFKKLEKENKELSTKCKELAENVGALTVENERLKHTAITIDMVEKAAYDVVQSYIKSGDSHRSDAWAVTSSDALVAVLATRMTERIKQYAKEY